jgi:hypothetical protein
MTKDLGPDTAPIVFLYRTGALIEIETIAVLPAK